MPGKNEIVAGIRLEGEKEFRQEITSVNKSIAVSRSELKKTEVVSAFKYMSLAGWSTQQQLDGIDGVLNLAAASGMELADASDMVTDYLSAFGMQASESAKMADMLAFAQANSNTTAQQWEMHTETALLSFIQADRI